MAPKNSMKVVILCGGKGTRLKEKTESLPKPLIEIGNRPILWHIMKIYSHYGFNDFVLCLGYKAQMIKEYFMDWQSWKYRDFKLDLTGKDPKVQNLEDQEKWKITFADTGEETNTGGRIKKIAHLITEKSFMVTYGDGVADIHIPELIQFHESHGRIGTVTAVRLPSQFGLLEISQDRHVHSFREKPKMEDWINGGFFVFQREFLNDLSETDVLEKKPLEVLSKGKMLMAYPHESFWKCMDTYKDNVTLNELWAANKAPWKLWSQK